MAVKSSRGRHAPPGLPSSLRAAKGFTLGEIMIAMAILGIIILGISEMLQQSSRFFILNRARLELQNEARSIMTLMNRNIRQAKANSVKIDQVSGQAYYSRITFDTVDNIAFKFYQDAKELWMESGTNKKQLSENTRYMAFAMPRSDDMTILSVSLTLEKVIYIHNRQMALHMASEKVRIMNE